MAPEVSICIATCRRPEGLARLLDSLVRQKLTAGPRFEVLVVDNDADESAAPVLARFRDALPLRSSVEPRRNIALARNRALGLARGRWLAFVDDDEEADEGWLAAYWERVSSDEPADGWFGPVLPRLAEPGPEWLDVERFYGRRPIETGAVLGAADLSTSNAFVRRSWLDVRRFDASFGRSGGSDTELFARLLRAGASFRWCDEARVTETIPPERHNAAWLAQRAFRGGVVTTRLDQRRLGFVSALVGRTPRVLAALAVCGAALPAAAAGGRANGLKVALRACTQAGHLWALVGGGYEEYGG